MEKIRFKEGDFLKLSNAGKAIICSLIASGVLVIEKEEKVDEKK